MSATKVHYFLVTEAVVLLEAIFCRSMIPASL
jgi:hypothetical protein